MNSRGTVERIHVAPEQGADPTPVEEVEAVPGRGLRGDRYFAADGTFSDGRPRDVTFIEAETLDAVERDYEIALEPGVHRRNVTTRGIALNHLVDEQFTVGGVRCEGVELCEPCSYLESHLEARGVREALVHRGGLRAKIVDGGTIAVGDDVSLDP